MSSIYLFSSFEYNTNICKLNKPHGQLKIVKDPCRFWYTKLKRKSIPSCTCKTQLNLNTTRILSPSVVVPPCTFWHFTRQTVQLAFDIACV